MVNGEKLFITNAVPGRTIGLVCKIDDVPSVLIVDLPEQEDETFHLNRYGIYALRRGPQQRTDVQKFSCAGRKLAHARSRRRTDDRLPRIESGSRFTVCERRGDDAVDDGRDVALGGRTDRPTVKRSSIANWCVVGSVGWQD